MKVDVLLGLQWGDEGKGKVVDVLTPEYSVITRFQGGPNAGHTLVFNGEKYVLRSIPSGIFQGGKINIIGNGVVLDPALFKGEAEDLVKAGKNAGADVREAAKLVMGGGGGQPGLATAGGKSLEGLSAAAAKLVELATR